MDVDWLSSAKDVRTPLLSLRAESCVFSHEIPSSALIDGRPRQTTGVLPPVVEAFA
jgi:hypothetical protein